jgi:DNA-binding response OmpR family regulator
MLKKTAKDRPFRAEYEVLAFLAENPGKTLPPEVIYNNM